MDLVLLKPGDSGIVSGAEGGSSMIGSDVNTLDGFTADTLDGCIELVSYHYGMKQQITTDVSNAARTSGRPEINDITAVKYFDGTSTQLYQACLSAASLGSGSKLTKIYLCRNNPGGDDNVIANIMTIELRDAIISSIQCQSHPNDMATEQLTINFTAIQWTFSAQINDPKMNGNKVAGWNISTNRPTSL